MAQADALHASEHLRGIHVAIRHSYVRRIPERGACAFGEVAVVDTESATLPEDVFPLETTIVGFEVRCLLKRRFAHMDSNVSQDKIVLAVQWALAAIFLILYSSHFSMIKMLLFFVLKF